MKPFLALILVAFGAMAFGAPPAGALRPLDAAGIPKLLEPPPQGTRIVMFWGLDCAYCEPNMQALAELQRAHPQAIDLVTVATDDINADRAAIVKRLVDAGMLDFEARAYTEAAPQRMNFLVDPAWGGVLPYTIVIGADGAKRAMIGALTKPQLHSITP